MQISPAIRKKAETVTGEIRSIRALSGGDINEVFQLTAARGEFVLKTRVNPPAGFFASEAAGLGALHKGGLDVPRVYATSEDYLLMEFLPSGKPEPVRGAEMLAALHNRQAGVYGYETHSYLATLLQNNTITQSASGFYFNQRLLALTGARDTRLWEKFSEKIAPLLDSCPAPALLHGDLWSGNLFHAERGPVFIDPAVYYGDPLTDIAMTRLFGGFGQKFYDTYFSLTAPRADRENLIAVFQIYPLLVHAKLFGGGYYTSAAAIRDRFL